MATRLILWPLLLLGPAFVDASYKLRSFGPPKFDILVTKTLLVSRNHANLELFLSYNKHNHFLDP